MVVVNLTKGLLTTPSVSQRGYLADLSSYWSLCCTAAVVKWSCKDELVFLSRMLTNDFIFEKIVLVLSFFLTLKSIHFFKFHWFKASMNLYTSFLAFFLKSR